MKKVIFLFCLSCNCLLSFSQNGNEFEDLKKIKQETRKQKTANSKDILTSLFRASIDNLMGDGREFNLNTTLYGLDSIFRGKSDGPGYTRERKLKQHSINLGITGDSSNYISKFSGGMTLTLVNKKDIKIYEFNSQEKQLLQKHSLLLADVKKKIHEYLAEKSPATYTAKKINDSWNKAEIDDDFSLLNSEIKEALKDPVLILKILNNQGDSFTKEDVNLTIQALLNGKSRLQSLFEIISQKYARKPLWTFTPKIAYDRVNKQGEYSFASEFTVGLGKDLNKRTWEMEMKASFKIANDTTMKKTNYKNRPFSISLGFNKVLIQNDEKESQMEFKLFTQYERQMGNVYIGEKASIFSFNSTFRVNLFKSVWLPLTIKYDIENSNFLGFLAVTANIGD